MQIESRRGLQEGEVVAVAAVVAEPLRLHVVRLLQRSLLGGILDFMDNQKISKHTREQTSLSTGADS